MKRYKILIEETVVGAFHVEAENLEEAIDCAIKNYKNCVFVNEPGELVAKQMAIVNPHEEVTEWFEF